MWKPLHVQVIREVRVSDGMGGKSSTPTPLAGLYVAERHKYRRESWNREETTSGVLTQSDMYFAFKKTPLPALLVNDTLKEVETGTKWEVLNIRPYDDRLEVDVRRMQ